MAAGNSSHISCTILVLLIFAKLSSCANINYVTPHPNISCPAQPCLTLSQYVQEAKRYFTSNTTFVFLGRKHELSAQLALNGISNITLTGNTSLSPQFSSEIKCTRRVGIKFDDVSEVKVTALAFASCGVNTSNNGAIYLTSAQNISFSDCTFHSNAFTAFSANHSSFTLNKVTFANNSQSALRIYNSCVNSIYNSTFINNSGVQGGAAYIFNSTVIFTGTTVFESNSARYSGGSLYLQHSTVSFTGVNLFQDSHASGRRYYSGDRYIYHRGGVLRALSAHLDFVGETSFVSSSATLGGGILATDHTNMSFIGNYILTNNSAQLGGGIFAYNHATMTFNGNYSFINNSASSGGGIAAFSDTTMNFDGNYNFINNSASEDGGGIYAKSNTIMSFNGNYGYINNSASENGGGIYARSNTIMSFNGNYGYINNSGRFGGGIYARSNTTMTFNGNYGYISNLATDLGGGVMAYTDATINFDGNCSFINNSASQSGGGIATGKSTISLHGVCTFTNNTTTRYGGGIALSGSVYYLFHGSRTYFTGNHAQRGGAIYVADSRYDFFQYCSTQPITNLDSTCFLQPSTSYLANVSVTFEANSAQEAGDDIYGGTIDIMSCNWPFAVSTIGELIDILAPGLTEDKLSSISSDPVKVCTCSSTGRPDCDRNISITSYPGETFTVTAVAVGQRNGTVPSVIHSIFEKGSSASLKSDEDFQKSSKICTSLNYTVFSNKSSKTVNLYVDGPCGPDWGQPLSILVKLQPCPDGFELSTTRACICEKRLQTYTNSCDINRQTISRDRHSEFWVGYDNETGGLILHPYCPFDYCKSQPVDFTLNDTDLQCNYNRSGLLCGNCQPGLSLALGSSRCLECSDTYLTLLVAFVLAGLCLVFFLLICRLTVAVGTISGLIFYANIVAVNQSIFFPQNLNIYGRFLSVFIAWLNLDLGIETCLYNGMDVYAKTWLQFMFPIYIWILVGLMIISSYYSTTVAKILHGTNPVAILATLFLLSYTKILRTIIAALSFTNLQFLDDTRTVWLYDGNITYLSGKHILLFITALTVFMVLFLPYTLLLLTGQFLQANTNHRMVAWLYSRRLKPFMDAYHGPYKDKHRYWPGLLLVVRVILLIIFSSNPFNDASVNLLTISTCITGLLTLELLIRGIYKKWYLEALEAFFFLNLSILAAASLYVRATGARQTAVTYTLVSAVFIVFIGILTYHVYLQLTDAQILKRMQATITTRRAPQDDNVEEPLPQTETVEVIDDKARAAVPMTVVAICNRESLIFDTEVNN